LNDEKLFIIFKRVNRLISKIKYMALTIENTSTEKIEPRLKVLIYGNPGVGKTSLAVSSGETLLVDVENGGALLGLRGIKVDRVKLSSWSETKEVLELCRSGKWKTVAIDPIGELLDKLLQELRLSGYGANKGDSLSLQGWGVAKEKFRQLMRSFRDLDMNVIFVAHSSEKKEEEATLVRPKLQASLDEDVCGMMDVVGYLKMEKADKKRVRRLYTQPTEKYYAKDRTGSLPEYIEEPTLLAVREFVAKNPHMNELNKKIEKSMDNFTKDL
jgi:phage nucleotide-binding protein